jgi:succinylarginine dihydrolase
VAAREYNFDGLVGPTHNYAGLSPGNVASISHRGQPANPRAAALQGLSKMRFVASLGVGQALLPPHERPSLRTLRRLGFRGRDEEVLARAASDPELSDQLLRISSSAAAMWTANAATVVPSSDAADGKLHLMPANLMAMFHRSLEARTTTRVLRAIFADRRHFEVHDPLPGGAHFADEGAANHTRLFGEDRPAVHLFAWGRRAFGGPSPEGEPSRYPARQTREASHALARLGQVDAARALFPQQHPLGIDAGAFHTDVLAVGSGKTLLLHERAFCKPQELLTTLRELLGDGFFPVLATEEELPAAAAISAYPFNSQLLALPDGTMTVLAPEEARDEPHARAFLERVVAARGPVRSVHYLDLRQSMKNGGGPACLRQRIVLDDDERAAIKTRVFWDEQLGSELEAWIRRNYRDHLAGTDLFDPMLAQETLRALDELTQILRLGSIYDFQK